MTSKGWLLITLVLIIAAALPAYCQKESFGGSIIIEDIQPGPILNPALADSFSERQKISLLYPRLIRPELEESVSRSIILRYIPRRSENSVRLFLRDRDTNPAGRLVTALDFKTQMELVLGDTNTNHIWYTVLNRLQGAQAYKNNAADSVTGIIVESEFVVRLQFDNQRMAPLSMFADSHLAASRDYVGPRYFSTGRGPFFRDTAGVYSANKQYCFGRPYIDFVLLGTSGSETMRRNAIVLNLAMIRDGKETPGNVALTYPGKNCVYVVFNSNSAELQSKKVRHFLAGLIDAESLATIFFKDTADVLHRLVPDEYLPFDSLPVKNEVVNSIEPISRPLLIAYPAGKEQLKLIAERLLVDLLVARVETRLVSYAGNPPANADMVVASTLVHEDIASHGIWKLLNQYLPSSNQIDSPWIDEVAWLLEMEKLVNAESLIVPLLQTDHTVYLPPSLQGVRFFIDGTLDFEDAWITRRRNGR